MSIDRETGDPDLVPLGIYVGMQSMPGSGERGAGSSDALTTHIKMNAANDFRGLLVFRLLLDVS
jgi:hypothetical protein